MVGGTARMESRRSARALAVAAGVFLVWRGLFARRGGGLATLAIGVLVLRSALRPGGGSAEGSRRRRTREVVEVKSPAELDPGIASPSTRGDQNPGSRTQGPSRP